MPSCRSATRRDQTSAHNSTNSKYQMKTMCRKMLRQRNQHDDDDDIAMRIEIFMFSSPSKTENTTLNGLHLFADYNTDNRTVRLFALNAVGHTNKHDSPSSFDLGFASQALVRPSMTTKPHTV